MNDKERGQNGSDIPAKLHGGTISIGCANAKVFVSKYDGIAWKLKNDTNFANFYHHGPKTNDIADLLF